MIARRALLLCAASALGGAAPVALPPPTPQATIDGAARTVKTLHGRLGKSFAPLLSQAKAVLVAPSGASGPAVLLMRWHGHWSEPAFFDAVSLRGAKPAVLLIMSDDGLDEVLHQHGLTLDGPNALSLAALPGKTAAALLVWPKTAQLDPAGFQQDDAVNALWYGRPRTAPEIVGGTPPDVRSSALRGALDGKAVVRTAGR